LGLIGPDDSFVFAPTLYISRPISMTSFAISKSMTDSEVRDILLC